MVRVFEMYSLIQAVYLFGSVASDKTHHESDLDLEIVCLHLVRCLYPNWLSWLIWPIAIILDNGSTHALKQLEASAAGAVVPAALAFSHSSVLASNQRILARHLV